MPLNYDVKRIKGTTDWYRIRLGDYRIVYWVDEEKHEVGVHRVDTRGDAYGY
jgi:mRNA-degrading endonuclease RelE of RelBE toxin-antitoxin system